MTWWPIATAPHNIEVLLFSPATEHTPAVMEVGCASTGQRYANGYSSISYHGRATHWQMLPEAPR